MKYLALDVVTFPVGAELGLDASQAANRKYVTRPHPARKGWYVATVPLQIKAGESFHYDGDLPKSSAAAVEPAAKAKQKATVAGATGGTGGTGETGGPGEAGDTGPAG